MGGGRAIGDPIALRSAHTFFALGMLGLALIDERLSD